MGSFLSIIAVGFFLGMRHATDPDHVIAVTTIVTRQRQLKRAAMTGAFWGVGHTLTIFVVGAMIILFNVVIPTRLGLSMEFSVALMLIVLGIMNVAAFMRSASAISAAPARILRPCMFIHMRMAITFTRMLTDIRRKRTLIALTARHWHCWIVSSASSLYIVP